MTTLDGRAGSLPADSGYYCYNKRNYMWVALAIFPFTIAR